MAGWLAGAAIGADLLFGNSPDTYTPWQQADAQWKMNPNVNSYFGSTTFNTDDMGTPNRYRDDVRTVNQTLSPQMQALADKMMGMAGRSRETFKSGGMGSGLGRYMNQHIGVRPKGYYDRGQYGFGQGYGPTEVAIEDESSEIPASNVDPVAYQDLMDALAKSREKYGAGRTGGPDHV